MTEQALVGIKESVVARDALKVEDLRDIVESTYRADTTTVAPVPVDALRTLPTLTAERSTGKYGHLLENHSRHSSLHLAIDRMPDVKEGELVLADVNFTDAVVEKSQGIIVQTLEAHLVQVVFKCSRDLSLHSLIVPIERICIPALEEDDNASDYSSDDP